MPIEVVCSGCQKRMKAPDAAAGKKTKCPHCQTIIAIPGGSAEAVAAAPVTPTAPVGEQKQDSWQVKLASGDVYGPTTKAELDQWVTEGRLDEQSQLLQAGSNQWQWASDFYPQLAAGSQVPDFGASPTPQTAAAQAPAFQQQPVSTPAVGANPFSVEAAPSNPYAAGSTATHTHASGGTPGGAIAVSVYNFILSALVIPCGLLIAFASQVVASWGFGVSRASGGRDAGIGDAVGSVFVIVIIIGILYIAYGVLLIVGGVGLLTRANWGRILTLVCAGISGVLALLGLYATITTGMWQQMISVLIFGGHCGVAFGLLFTSSVSRAFRK